MNSAILLKNYSPKLNLALYVAAGIFIFLALLTLISLPFRLEFRSDAEEKPFIDSDGQSLSLNSVGSSEQILAAHALFYIPPPKVVIPQQQRVQIDLSKYQVTGLIQGDPQEAIVKNVLTNETYFVRVGESFETVELLEIKRRSIVVGAQGERHEISIEGNI